MNDSEKVANALLDIGAVLLKPKKPIRLASGVFSPVYVDNRILPSHPKQWRHVIEGFGNLIGNTGLVFDIIAGIAVGAVPHSSALAFYLGWPPAVFVRKKEKKYGKNQRIEGGNVQGKTVVLVEDHISTGSSSLEGVRVLRNGGATVNECLAITTFARPESVEAFATAGVILYTLTTFEVILQQAFLKEMLTEEEVVAIEHFMKGEN